MKLLNNAMIMKHFNFEKMHGFTLVFRYHNVVFKYHIRKRFKFQNLKPGIRILYIVFKYHPLKKLEFLILFIWYSDTIYGELVKISTWYACSLCKGMRLIGLCRCITIWLVRACSRQRESLYSGF